MAHLGMFLVYDMNTNIYVHKTLIFIHIFHYMLFQILLNDYDKFLYKYVHISSLFYIFLNISHFYQNNVLVECFFNKGMFWGQFLSINGMNHHGKSCGTYGHILLIYCTFLDTMAFNHTWLEGLNKIYHKDNTLSNLLPLSMVCTSLYDKTHHNYVFNTKVINCTLLCIDGLV